MTYNRQLCSIKLPLAAVLAVASLLAIFSLALAQAGAKVYPQQAEASGPTLAVDVIAENVTSMYGAEFRVKYDPAVLRVLDAIPDQEGVQILPGSLLPADQGFVVANQVNEAEGTVVFALTLLRPAAPVSGSGPLARITFEVVQDQPSTINVEHAKLVSIDPAEPGKMPQTIPSELAALSVAGSAPAADTAPPPPAVDNALAASAASHPVGPSGEFPWWIVAVIVLTLGLLVLGAFIIMGEMKKSEPALQPASRPAGSRPSAFSPASSPAEVSREPGRWRR